MALIQCPECGNQISNKSVACVYCGLPSSNFPHPNDEEQIDKNLIQTITETNIGPNSNSNSNTSGINSNINTESNIKSLTETDINIDYNEIKNIMGNFDIEYLNLFAVIQYISLKDVEKIKRTYEKYYINLQNQLILQFIRTNASTLKIDILIVNRFLEKMKNIDINRNIHNENFITSKLSDYQVYFDNLLKIVDPNIKLDEEQRRAILTEENHCLLVAGAGAGKTTTMAAKVKYLVDKQGIRPEDIIVISYTNKAIDELKERINGKLKIPAKINTFHAFAYDIVRHSSSNQPEINFSAYNIIFEMLEKRIFDNKQLTKNLVLFLGFYFDLPEDALKFNSLNEYHLFKANSDYETLKSGLGEYVNKIADQRNKSKRTITGEYLRSMQEVQIANFLYLNNIDYQYEKPYPFGIHGSRKIYTPDFHISQGEHECYIEHYGITQNMTNSVYTDSQLYMYKKNIQDKRALHKSFDTELLETWSIYNDGRQLLVHLKEEMLKRGFVLKSRNHDDVYKKLVETGKDKYIYKFIYFILEFINQYKTTGFDSGGFDVLRSKTDNVRNLLFLNIAQEVYNYYQEALKSKNQIDFADMINDAYLLLCEIEKTGVKLPYKYIVIDEFQDIARQRFNLTKQLAAVTDAKVVAVGDDWQSIYAFAGSDITLFTKFIELMGSGVELKITNTYRNSQELIDIAGGFIQKNSEQIQKKLKSPKNLKDPIILEFYDDSYQLQKNLAKSVVECIGKIISEFGESKSILLIGRYTFDMIKLFRSGDFQEVSKGKIKCVKYPKAKVSFMTAHGSKGLGYDNVIILNVLESKYGFPCQIEDDPIMKMVRYEDKSMPYAEERRLFYVALTRTKNRVYIATPLHKPSRFIVEIVKDYKIPYPKDFNTEIVDLFSLKCPVCGFPLKYEFNKNYGLGLYICTNEVEICDFMTNDKFARKDIYKCPKCKDGYMIVKCNKTTSEKFYGCTNYSDSICKNMQPIKD